MHTFLAPAWLACAFLARVLRIARASLDRVLSKTAAASLRSYSRGSYKTSFTVRRRYTEHTPPPNPPTAPHTHGSRTHPRDRAFQCVGEWLIQQPALTRSPPPPAHFLTARLPGRSPSSADDQGHIRDGLLEGCGPLLRGGILPIYRSTHAVKLTY